MTLSPPGTTDWVMDLDASNHMTPDSGNITLFRPSRSTSIIAGNGSTLRVTDSRHSIISGLFYINNILVAPNIVQNLIYVRQFTSDNNCSIVFDPLGFSVKDLHSKNVISRYNSSGSLYTLAAPTCSTVSRALVATVSSTTWHPTLTILGMRLCPNSIVLLPSVVIKLLVIPSVMLVKLGITLAYLL